MRNTEREDAPDRRAGMFTPLARSDRLALVESLTEGSCWSVNFGMMLGCSVLIAGLGLLQNSAAVIIGAMLVAPLMTPLIGTGLGLVQGNFKLLQEAGGAMLKGSALSLALGVLIRLLTPGHELTPEVSIRGEPNLLDLFIAFLAGVAAGYAVARPGLSSALPGVAISVALVPPLAAAGIAMGSMDWLVSVGAVILAFTNMVAIVLGSALVFRLHNIRAQERQRTKALKAKRITVALAFILVLLMAPLGYRLVSQVREGQANPESFTLSEDLWFELHNRLDRAEGVDFLTGVRASSERPEDVTLVVTADRPVPVDLLSELDQMIDDNLGTDVKVKISVLQQGTVDTNTTPDDKTVVNE